MSKRRELIERQRAQQRRQTGVVLTVIAAIAVLMIGGAVVLSMKPSAPARAIVIKQSVPANAEQNGRAWGPVDAPIKVVMYQDYQCPSCGQFANQYEQAFSDQYAKTGKVRFEVREWPFIGQESFDAANAALCAMDQDKFWQMNATIFANQSRGENKGDFTNENLQSMAAQLGLDTGQLSQCMSSNKYSDTINRDRAEGNSLGVNSTPTFSVNGKMIVGVQSPADFKRIFAQVAPDVKFQ